MANLVPTPIEKGTVNRSVREGFKGDVNSLHAPTAGNDAVVTITAPDVGSGLCVLVERIDWSYSAAPTGGRLTVTDGGSNTYFDIDITAGGNGYAEISRVLPKETQAVITLAGAVVTGKLDVSARLVN